MTVAALTPGDVKANGIRLHYLRSGGEARPPLVLAHGMSDSGACWASLIRVLARDFDVIAYDARGHGRSEAPQGGYAGEQQAGDLLGLIDALELECPILMGHSMGGETAAWAAAQRPDGVRALILEDSGIPSAQWPRTREQREKMHEGLARWIGGLKSKSVAELVALVAENDPRWPEEDRLPWAESKHAMSQAAIDGFALAERRDVTEQYPGMRCPVLFLKADADEAQRRKHREVVSRLPHAEIVWVEGAGHNVRRDEPARTAYHLGRFFSRSS